MMPMLGLRNIYGSRNAYIKSKLCRIDEWEYLQKVSFYELSYLQISTSWLNFIQSALWSVKRLRHNEKIPIKCKKKLKTSCLYSTCLNCWRSLICLFQATWEIYITPVNKFIFNPTHLMLTKRKKSIQRTTICHDKVNCFRDKKNNIKINDLMCD